MTGAFLDRVSIRLKRNPHVLKALGSRARGARGPSVSDFACGADGK